MGQKALTKKQIRSLRERLSYAPRLVWDAIDRAEKKKALAYSEDYKSFLDSAKTEREAVRFIRREALRNGFKGDVKAGSGSPFIWIFHDKAIALARPGKIALDKGLHLVVSHIDAPRLDLKQKPLYEEVDLAFFKTHYYGGIKKYQWLARPLAIHGRVVKGDGSVVDIAVGEGENDPVFTVLDLLPHLARKAQYSKKLGEAIEGEKLNVLVGSLPLGDKDTKDRFKLAVLQYLSETYGMLEEDFISAELEVVPAGRARDVGWDRALIGAYGHDDRSCAFAALKAIMDVSRPEKSAIALFVDKEEIGSDGATGAKSKFLEAILYNLMLSIGMEPSTRAAYEILTKSRALSGDVNGALDPDYQDVHEKRNAARMGYGVCLTKFTGHGGKYNSNDASAEYVGWLRNLFNKEKVVWQTGELGKVDEGGGGTVAKFLAVYGMQVIDCGPAVLSMHSPFEIAHKGDLYMTYKGYRVFFQGKH
ncbi:MAG: aminopeptidase [Deltaproteobacteria bacterium]|nr:MAG: aminopeptidase [Deltaproteobacteria bacterium]